MTEQEWLASDDPAAMLAWLTMSRRSPPDAIDRLFVSDRKLRLFACAVARVNQLGDVSGVERCVEAGQPNHNFSDARDRDEGRFWAVCNSSNAAVLAAERFPNATVAALLHDVVGNPWRPVTLHQVCLDPDWSPTVWGCPWLTPTVLALAHAAYQERGSKCGSCEGTGNLFIRLKLGKCPDCHGTGKSGDGLLDPVTLAILADALEEAGCTGDRCRDCRGDGVLRGLYTGLPHSGHRCKMCNGTGRVLHPLLAHLRDPGPHVAGCWATDLILSKE